MWAWKTSGAEKTLNGHTCKSEFGLVRAAKFSGTGAKSSKFLESLFNKGVAVSPELLERRSARSAHHPQQTLGA